MYQTLYKMNKYVPAFRAQRGRKDIQIIQIPTSHDECLYSQAPEKGTRKHHSGGMIQGRCYKCMTSVSGKLKGRIQQTDSGQRTVARTRFRRKRAVDKEKARGSSDNVMGYLQVPKHAGNWSDAGFNMNIEPVHQGWASRRHSQEGIWGRNGTAWSDTDTN